MITNGRITIYHKEIDQDHNEIWKNKSYEAWSFITQSSNSNNGLSNSNSINIRIPFQKVIANIGDIVIKGEGKKIERSTDVKGYIIKSITENEVGSQPHIHILGA